MYFFLQSSTSRSTMPLSLAEAPVRLSSRRRIQWALKKREPTITHMGRGLSPLAPPDSWGASPPDGGAPHPGCRVVLGGGSPPVLLNCFRQANGMLFWFVSDQQCVSVRWCVSVGFERACFWWLGVGSQPYCYYFPSRWSNPVQFPSHRDVWGKFDLV